METDDFNEIFCEIERRFETPTHKGECHPAVFRADGMQYCIWRDPSGAWYYEPTTDYLNSVKWTDPMEMIKALQKEIDEGKYLPR